MFDKIIHLNKISNLEDECECLICKKIFKKYWMKEGLKIKVADVNSIK